MVKVLTAGDGKKIHEAVFQAEQATCAEIAVVVARASDEYRAAALLCGLALGTLAAIAVWRTGLFATVYMPLSVQLAVMAMFEAVPFLRHWCSRVEPAHHLKRRAAQRAATEYTHLLERLPPPVPIVMLYVSIAERYVHIHTTRSVREKIPLSEWDAVVATLTAAVKTHGLSDAVAKAVAHAGELLAAHFPPDGKVHDAVNIVEI